MSGTYVEHVGEKISRHLEEIQTYFVDGMKLTFVARMPGNNEADMVLTNDVLLEAEETIKRRRLQGLKGKPTAE